MRFGGHASGLHQDYLLHQVAAGSHGLIKCKVQIGKSINRELMKTHPSLIINLLVGFILHSDMRPVLRGDGRRQ